MKYAHLSKPIEPKMEVENSGIRLGGDKQSEQNICNRNQSGFSDYILQLKCWVYYVNNLVITSDR
jgi:hypothetical protein